MRALQPGTQQPVNSSFCEPCVYFSRNLDPVKLESDVSSVRQDACGLDFLPGDGGCSEMRTNNCSARKGKS